jgi:hypothetical protein
MKNIIKVIGTAALALAVGVAAVAPADAAPPWIMNHHAYHRHFAHNYGYRGYSYGPGYYGYGYGYDPGAAIVGGLVGGVFGALADRALSGGGSHVARCEAHYRSYVRATNTYTGYDGAQHICRL